MTTETADKSANVAPQRRRVAPRQATAKNGPTRKKAAPKRKTATKSAKPKKTPASKRAARAESKTATILSLVGRAKGASLAAIMSAWGWRARSVRGFISVVQSRRGLKIESAKNAAGERFYKLGK